MFGEILCFLGFHNWCIIEHSDEGKVEDGVDAEISPESQFGQCRKLNGRYDLNHKICKRCLKEVNEIENHYNHYKREKI